MPLVKVANRTSVQTGKLNRQQFNGTTLILLEHEGKVKAFQGTCPHQGTLLSDGHIEENQIVCPLHQWSFSCLDGKNIQHNKHLKQYTIVEKADQLFLNSDEFAKTDENEIAEQKIITIRDLPSPKATFILGHIPQFKAENKHQVVENWIKECGPLFKIHFLGKKFIVSADPKINAFILKSRPEKFRRFSKINEVLEEIKIVGVFNAEGSRWTNQRKVIAEALNLKNVKGFFPALSSKTNSLLQRWKKLEAQSQKIDVQQEMMRYTVDITTCIAFGYDTNTLEQDGDVIQTHLEKIFPMINKRITAPLPVWRYLKSKKDREFDYALKEIEKTIHVFIQTAKQKLAANPALKESPSNLLEALLVQQETQGKFTDQELFGNVFITLLAGEDTTSNSISWALYYIALHPEVMKKVQEEADLVLGNDLYPTRYEQIDQLKYTEAAATEGMRLKPVTPMLYMEALEDTVIHHLKVKKGTAIMMQNQVPQKDDQYFTNALEFKPERWVADTGKCPVHGAHQPEVMRAFGAGPRYCPGKNLAMHEMVMALSMIFKNFDIQLVVKPEEVQERFAFTMFPENLLLKINKRKINRPASPTLVSENVL